MSPNRDQRVVVTGVGATSPVGGTAPETWEAILAGTSGARTMDPERYPWVAKYDLPVTFAATLHTPPEEALTRVEIKRLDPMSQYALIAGREAWGDAGTPEVDPERLGVAVGTGIGGVWTLLDAFEALQTRGPRRVMPLTVPMLMPNAAAATLSLDLKARAGAHTVVSACSSGSEAMSQGAAMIRAGRADVVVSGGTEAAVHALPIAGFAAAQALSRRNEDPAHASRPYDAARDGFVLGEGAAMLVLESYEYATARGARIYAEVASTGMSADAYHITAGEPEGLGAARAMAEALELAGLTASDISHINAHATSTPVGDIAEYHGLRRTFGDALAQIPVSATKSMTGHLLGAAGALESILTVLAVHHRLAPPTINLDHQDPQIELDVVTDKPRDLPQGEIAALNNAFGFGGHNVAQVIRSVG